VKIKEGDLVIDAGANIGLFSILASQKVGRTGKIFAFEPIEQTRELLARNILNNRVNNIHFVPFALGSRNTDLELIKSDNLGESSFFCKGNFPKIKVKQTTLDNFVREKQLKKVDFIKADIEGMERDLIRGAKETIIKFKPKISICIYHRSDDAQIIGELLKSFVSVYHLTVTPTKLYAWI